MPFRPPSLRAVAAFEAAARHQSFAKAADELNLTQSAISHAIRGLEDRLGEQLFERCGRNVALTHGGRRLAQRLRLSLSLLSDAFDGVSEAGDARRLVVGAPAAFTHRVLVPRLRRFHDREPDTVVELRTDLGVDGIASGEADLVIVAGGGSWVGLASLALMPEQLVPVAAPELARLAALDLMAVPLVEAAEFPWAIWFGQGDDAAPILKPSLVVNDWDSAVEAACQGLGACLAPATLVCDLLAEGALVRVGEPRANPRFAYHLVWPREPHKAPRLAGFVAWLAEEAERMSRGAPDAEGPAPDETAGPPPALRVA